MLGKNYAGTLGVDGWAPYRCFKEATLQTCYNHLLHRCHELLETATRGAVRFPRLVKAILRHALALRDRRDAGEISPHGLRVAKGLLQAKMNRLLHGRFTNPANQRFAKHLRRYRDNLFVFLDRADVEATNYPAEQEQKRAWSPSTAEDIQSTNISYGAPSTNQLTLECQIYNKGPFRTLGSLDNLSLLDGGEHRLRDAQPEASA